LGADLPAKAAFYGVVVCWWLFGLTFWFRKSPPRAREAKRDLKSYLGLFFQAAGYFIVWYIPLRRHEFTPLIAGPGWFAWSLAGLTLAIAVASTWLVSDSVRRLGKQWGLAARLVEDHTLIQEGPYRFVRNPIYAGMFGMLLATGLAVSRPIPLFVATILFAAGTVVRIRMEERLLREAFGSKFEEYAHRVPALIPGIY
jgi:protein-S-isoprenylcysteine O-methyltransferase Ste14